MIALGGSMPSEPSPGDGAPVRAAQVPLEGGRRRRTERGGRVSRLSAGRRGRGLPVVVVVGVTAAGILGVPRFG